MSEESGWRVFERTTKIAAAFPSVLVQKPNFRIAAARAGQHNVAALVELPAGTTAVPSSR
ncbi:MAG: hypothetical protein ABI592_04410 [Acidobacteriota bacterium]